MIHRVRLPCQSAVRKPCVVGIDIVVRTLDASVIRPAPPARTIDASMSNLPLDDAAAPHDAYAALRVPSFRRYLIGNVLALLGAQMQFVAVGWDIYERTGQSLQLGLVGLVQVVPVIVLALAAGQVIDRLDRRLVIVSSLVGDGRVLAGPGGHCVVAGGLSLDLRLSVRQRGGAGISAARQVGPVAADRAAQPVCQRGDLEHVRVSAGDDCRSGAGRIVDCGHAFGRVRVSARGPADLALVVAMRRIRPRPSVRSEEPLGLASLLAGVRFVWRTKLVLGAISLDMFAVLLGGATALLPVYAKDILHAGPEGLGWLRTAPGLGRWSPRTF